MTYTDSPLNECLPGPKPRYFVSYPVVVGQDSTRAFYHLGYACAYVLAHPPWGPYTEPRLTGIGAEESDDYYWDGLTDEEREDWEMCKRLRARELGL